CLVLLQYADDLFVCETIALHPLVLSNGPELTSKWIISTGQGQVLCLPDPSVTYRIGFTAEFDDFRVRGH
ncbi:hypothetical protein, partial [Rhizobium leguminosarum]|uniref:hypothetical protein n=1 Tax=Rhizobium leguminosarum TaxID=384 RepID=UPI001C970D8A